VYFLHLSLFFVILIDASTGSPVHVLMLSVQAVVFLACVHLALFLALSLSPGNPLFPHGVTVHSDIYRAVCCRRRHYYQLIYT